MSWDDIINSIFNLKSKRITAKSFIMPYLAAVIVVALFVGFLAYNDNIIMGTPAGAVVVEENTPDHWYDGFIPHEKKDEDNSTQTNRTGE